MVGRFESAELKRDALAHEDFSSRSGLLGRCSCMVALALIVVGVVLPLFSSHGDPGAGLDVEPATPPEAASSFAEPPPASKELPQDIYSLYGLSDVRGADFDAPLFETSQEDFAPLSVDFSLVSLVIAIVALCVVPPLMRTLCPGGAGFPGSFGQVMGGSLLPARPGGVANGLLGPDYAGGMSSRGRVVDVKPGELRGGLAWGGQQSGGPSFGGGWGRTGGFGAGGAMDWAGSTTPTFGGGGSWGSPVPSSHSGNGGLGGRGSFGGAFGATAWPGLGGAGATHAAASLPSEAEIMETYATYGVQLQQWVPALADLIDKQLIEPLLRELDASDQLWQQTLMQRGCRFTHEAPRLVTPGIGLSAQELSVFDRNLPRPLVDDPSMVDLWARRQQLESFLTHPSFEPAQRQSVLDRLREWRQRGLASAMRGEWRPSAAAPTDAHVLENLVVKMLAMYLDFGSCFMSSGQAPPPMKHQGQSPTAHLRQVTDQRQFPRPAPHYEVVTLSKVWKLRPGNTNILEALALLLHTLRRQSRSYQAFPPLVRAAIEAAGAGPTSPGGGALGGGFGVALGGAMGALGGGVAGLFGGGGSRGARGIAQPGLGFGQGSGQGFGQGLGPGLGQGLGQSFGQGLGQGFGQGLGAGIPGIVGGCGARVATSGSGGRPLAGAWF